MGRLYSILALVVHLSSFGNALSSLGKEASLPTRGEAFSVARSRRVDHTRDGLVERNRIFRRMGWPLPSGIPLAKDFPFNQGEAPAASDVSAGHEAPTQQGGNTPSTAAQSPANTTARPTATGSVNAAPEDYHAEYLAEISIGGQPLSIDFDTGSSDFWIFSTLLPPAYRAVHGMVYDPNNSATYKDLPGLTWEIVYGDYSAAKGVVCSEDVNIGGITVEGQSVELATNLTYSFVRDVANDGLVGLGFSNINNVVPTRQRTIFDNMRPLLKRALFSVNLLEDGTGSYDFGFVDPSALPAGTSEQSLIQIQVDPSYGFWQVPSPAYGIGGVFNSRPKGSPAIADSGTSLLLVDPPVAKKYWVRTI